MTLQISALRRQFPILKQTVDGHPLVYLDSAATTQKPQCVLDAVGRFYSEGNASVHRGVHAIAETSTEEYETARKTVQRFIHAKLPEEIIFTRNATESINLIARTMVKPGDSVVVTRMEHHSNIIPWMLAGARLQWVDVDSEGTLREEQMKEALSTKPKVLAITGMSNVLGCIPNLEHIIELAHEKGARVLVDGAQLSGHKNIDVQTLNCDFLVFSGHKVYGPLGVGVLYGKREHLEALPPFLGGGGMVNAVRDDGFSETEVPRKFEAGTPAAAEAVGLGVALTWMMEMGKEKIFQHEHAVLSHAHAELQSMSDVQILGPKNARDRSGCVSFTTGNVHPHDLTEILGRQGICLRAGHQCAEPLHRALGIPASSRLSVGAYSTKEEVDICIKAMKEAMTFLRGH